MTDERRYTLAQGVFVLASALRNGNAHGTGAGKLGIYAKNIIGPKLPQAFLDQAVSEQNNLFGNYPDSSDVAPSIVFAVAFFFVFLAHLGLFLFNYTRGHVFYISAGWAFIALLKCYGFISRAIWTKNILDLINLGLSGEVILIVSTIFLSTVNLVLAQRLFTWRHPVGGDRRLFRYFMIFIYVLVAVVIGGTVAASAIPYLYYLSRHAHYCYKVAVLASAALIIVYSLMAIALVGLSYFFKPTRKDENLYTYQPWWIESFHPFYFVKKGAAREAEETFMKRNHNHRHAVRVIAATHHHYNMVEGLTNERGSLSHNKSIMIVTFTTLACFVESIMRAIACFQTDPTWKDNVVCRPIVAYMCWGLLETLVHISYLIGRVDLRFYKPDVLPRKVRSIITAEQSFFASKNHSRQVSDDEDLDQDELDDDEYDDDYYDEEEEDDEEEYLFQEGVPPKYDDQKFEKFDSSNDNESDFRF